MNLHPRRKQIKKDLVLHPGQKQIKKDLVFLLKLKIDASRNCIPMNKEKTHIPQKLTTTKLNDSTVYVLFLKYHCQVK